MTRRILLTLVGAAAVCLVPWTVYLAGMLPDQHGTDEWRLAWVGFDVALVCCFAATTWLGLRRHRAALPMMTATAALLFCDAWFDVVLDGTWTSSFLAVFAEVPIAVILLWQARRLVVDGMPSRRLTIQDIEINGDASYKQLARKLNGLAPATADTLAAALGLPGDEVTTKLSTLAQAGYVRQGRDGRWRGIPQNIKQPNLDEVDEAERQRVAAYLDAKYDTELRLLTWAAQHRDEFGPWGKGHRAVVHLSEAELARFDAEYDDLLIRYCLLHNKPAPGTREVAIRCYAFPCPDEPIE
jgi:DNA-binding transcriptional ArsR family regulator